MRNYARLARIAAEHDDLVAYLRDLEGDWRGTGRPSPDLVAHCEQVLAVVLAGGLTDTERWRAR